MTVHSASNDADMPTQPPGDAAAPMDLLGHRRRENLEVIRAVLLFYLLDAAIVAMFAALGLVTWWAPGVLVVMGLVSCSSGTVAVQAGVPLRHGAASVNLPMTAFGCLVMLGMATWLPQIGGLMLMNLVVIVTTSALNLSGRHLVPLCLFMAAGAVAAIASVDQGMDLPSATWLERAATGLSFAIILGKAALVNVVGRNLRQDAHRLTAQLGTALEQVQQLAQVDGLTGLLNRRTVLALAEDERARAERSGQPFSVVLIDIDHFKRVNDAHGHAAGDEVLQRFAKLLTDAVRAVDKVARYGGEEFLVLMPPPCEASGAVTAMERLRSFMAATEWPACDGMKITASIGIASVASAEPIHQAIRRADAALYEAKRQGRDRVLLG
jgi:diguanylate cyclase (GGDEF)-like protein